MNGLCLFLQIDSKKINSLKKNGKGYEEIIQRSKFKREIYKLKMFIFIGKRVRVNQSFSELVFYIYQVGRDEGVGRVGRERFLGYRWWRRRR